MTLWEIRPPFFRPIFWLGVAHTGSPIIRNHRLVKVQNTRSGSHIFWKGAIYWCPKGKGQMNKKIDIFSFVVLPLPNTKRNQPKWDLGKDFSSQAFIERKMIKIRAFPKTSTKTFLKWPRDKLEETETSFGLCDVTVGEHLAEVSKGSFFVVPFLFFYYFTRLRMTEMTDIAC